MVSHFEFTAHLTKPVSPLGYGHATRVSAFATTLLSLDDKPEIYVVSSAPTHVFTECISHGAHYRYAEVDPVISQPLACVQWYFHWTLQLSLILFP